MSNSMNASIQLEREILGLMLSDPDTLNANIGELEEDYFFFHASKLVFSSMKALSESGRKVDLIMVRDDLDKSGKLPEAGGEEALVELASLSGEDDSIPDYIRELKDKWQKREVQKFATILSQAATVEDISDVMQRAEQFFLGVSSVNLKSDLKSIGSILQDEYLPMLDARLRKDSSAGISTGFRRIDDLTCGFNAGDLIIMAARPSVGKTTLATNMAVSVAGKGYPVAIFSIEMTNNQIVERILSAYAQVNASNLKHGTISEHAQQELIAASGSLFSAPLYIDETGDINPAQIKTRVKKLSSRLGKMPALVIIDHLQLIHMGKIQGRKFENREKEMAEISRFFKAMAKELGTTVLAVSQLSRASDKRGKGGVGDRPRLSDLRDSGALEQDADIVYLIHRPEAYDASLKGRGDEQEKTCEVIVAKSRNGETGVVPMTFQGQFYQFSEIESYAKNKEFYA